MSIEVAGLYTYPIKSCAPISLEQSAITERGLAYDREWVLLNPRRVAFTQRTNPELTLVQTQFDGDSLLATTPTGERLRLPLRANSQDCLELEIDIFKKVGGGIDQGDEAAEFFSYYLGKAARVFRVSRAREIKPETRVAGASDKVGFADAYAISLASVVSLAKLNSQMPEPVPITNFRPNIVIDGDCLTPYVEDTWRELRIGDLQAHIVRACARCPIPNVNQQTGVLPKKDQRIVTQTLRRTRAGIEPYNGTKEEFFQQLLSHVYREGTILEVGDQVRVMEQSFEPNFLPLLTPSHTVGDSSS